MSKAVRIRQHLYDEIERLAKAERRSMINQLELLLEQALKIESSETAVGYPAGSGTAGSYANREPERAVSDSHFKPDPK